MSTSALTHVRGARGWSSWWSLASGSCPLSSPQWHLATTAGTHPRAFSPSSLSSSPTESHRGPQDSAPCLGEVLLGYQGNLSAPCWWRALSPCHLGMWWALSPCQAVYVVGLIFLSFWAHVASVPVSACACGGLTSCHPGHLVGSVPLLTWAGEGHAVWADWVQPWLTLHLWGPLASVCTDDRVCLDKPARPGGYRSRTRFLESGWAGGTPVAGLP